LIDNNFSKAMLQTPPGWSKQSIIPQLMVPSF
jgi:hypothetical protein